MPKIITQEQLNTIFVDYMKGVPSEEIAEKNEINERSVSRFAKKYGWESLKEDLVRVSQENSKNIIAGAKKNFLETMAFATNTSVELIKEQIEDYMVRKAKSKKAKPPAFIPKNFNELFKLLELLGEKWEKPELKTNNTNIYNNNKVQIQQNTQQNVIAAGNDNLTLDKLLLNLSQMPEGGTLALAAPAAKEEEKIESIDLNLEDLGVIEGEIVVEDDTTD